MDVITFPENLETTILLHGVISLPDATSYGKIKYHILNQKETLHFLKRNLTNLTRTHNF